MKVPKQQDNLKKLPPGNYHAVCVELIDLGTHKNEYQGQVSYLRQIRIGFETVDEKEIFDESKGLEPYKVTRDFTLSIGEKSNLRKFLEGWRGGAYTQEDLDKLDLKVVLGLPCLLNVIHQKSKDGSKVYAKIQAATPLPKAMAKDVKVHNPQKYFSLDDPNWNTFETFHDTLKEKIKESPEYKNAVGNQDGGF
jgi:hypothetical protein